jgi:2-phosphosulfolactate phosphatase
MIRFDWGPTGAAVLAACSDVVVVIDVLSFTTAVEVVVSRGGTVVPARWADGRAASRAKELGAVLAVGRQETTPSAPYSLSPASLRSLPPGTRIVLPSPNGAAIALSAAEVGATVLGGCLRNATAVAGCAARLGASVGVVAAGERWDDGTLRPAFEDLIGAGAVLTALRQSPTSPEAGAAIAAFHAADPNTDMFECVSGRELVKAGFAEDVRMASELDVSDVVPSLFEGAFTSCERV